MQLALSKWVVLNDHGQSTLIKNKIKPKERKIQVQTMIGNSSGCCQIRIAPFMFEWGQQYGLVFTSSKDWSKRDLGLRH